MKILVRMSFLVVMFAALPMFAQMDWSMAGSTGDIDRASAGLYDTIGPSLGVRPGATGVVVARYPVTNTFGSAISKMPGWTTLQMAYSDNGPAATVRARLFRLDRCSNLVKVICEVKSVDGGTCDICHLVEPVDFNAFIYYVEADLTASTTAGVPRLHSVSIW